MALGLVKADFQALDYICSHVCNKIHFSCRFIYNVDVSLNIGDEDRK